MAEQKNALAELAESMKRKIGDFSSDESFMANLATLENANSPEDQKAAAFFREYALASRIVAELAKVGYWKSTGRSFADEASIAVSNCRVIAEEGDGDDK